MLYPTTSKLALLSVCSHLFFTYRLEKQHLSYNATIDIGWFLKREEWQTTNKSLCFSITMPFFVSSKKHSKPCFCLNFVFLCFVQCKQACWSTCMFIYLNSTTIITTHHTLLACKTRLFYMFVKYTRRTKSSIFGSDKYTAAKFPMYFSYSKGKLSKIERGSKTSFSRWQIFWTENSMKCKALQDYNTIIYGFNVIVIMPQSFVCNSLFRFDHDIENEERNYFRYIYLLHAM